MNAKIDDPDGALVRNSRLAIVVSKANQKVGRRVSLGEFAIGHAMSSSYNEIIINNGSATLTFKSWFGARGDHQKHRALLNRASGFYFLAIDDVGLKLSDNRERKQQPDCEYSQFNVNLHP